MLFRSKFHVHRTDKYMNACKFSGIVFSMVFFSACIENPDKSGSKPEYKYSRLVGVFTKYAGGKKESSSINGIRDYGSLFDTAFVLRYPQVVSKILFENGKYGLKIEKTDVTPGEVFPCEAIKNEILSCAAPDEFEGNITFTHAGDAFKIGLYAIDIYSEKISGRWKFIGKNKRAAYVDSLISSGEYDSIRYFQGNLIYE